MFKTDVSISENNCEQFYDTMESLNVQIPDGVTFAEPKVISAEITFIKVCTHCDIEFSTDYPYDITFCSKTCYDKFFEFED